MEDKIIKLYDGIELHLMNTNKFKTNYIVINLITDLSREDVTKNSLIALVNRRGTVKYPTMGDISIKLEEMYGSSLDANTDKIGDNQIIQFSMDSISDEYTLENNNLLEASIDMIKEIMLCPILENGVYKKEYVDQEKETLREIIESKINDKSAYALDRATEEMYKGEVYGIYKYGYVEDLDTITPEELYKQYQTLLATSTIYVYVSGNLNEEKVIRLFKEMFSNVKRDYKNDFELNKYNKIVNIVKDENLEEVASKREVLESQDVTQGKLVLGCVLQNASLKDDFYKMQVYSAILGGTASSKLFNNVREKKSLAYTIGSQYIKHKGIVLIRAGIELNNYRIARKYILRELNDMKNGEITDIELHDAKVNLETRFKSFNDSQGALIGWAIGQELLGGDVDLGTVISKINEVTKEDVIEVASRLKLDMVYYLKD